MKVISIWQPWASLIVCGHKRIETRGWSAPRSILGHTIGIASTRKLTKEQRLHIEGAVFSQQLEKIDLPIPNKLPLGCLLGTVILERCELITEDLMAGLSQEELIFGWYDIGRFAWYLRNPISFAKPIPVVGRQGLWNWEPEC